MEFPQIRVGVFSASAFVLILSFNKYTRTNLLKGGFDTLTTVLISHMYSTGMSEDSYAMAGVMSVISIVAIGSIVIYSFSKSRSPGATSSRQSDAPNVQVTGRSCIE